MDDDDLSSPWDQFSGIIADSIGTDSKNIDLEKAYSHAGGSSLNAVAAVLSLRYAGYDVSIEQFLQAECLRDLFAKSIIPQVPSDNEQKFSIRPLREVDDDEARTLVVRCFLKNSEFLTRFNYENEEEFKGLLTVLWPFLLPYSLAVFDRVGQLRGIALALDEFDGAKPVIEQLLMSQDPDSHITRVLCFLDGLTHPVEEELNPKHEPGVIFMKFMLAAANDLNTPEENVSIFYLMEIELKHLAEKNNFRWTLAQNVSPVTQQLSEYIGCRTFSKTVIKYWKSPEGDMPFGAVTEDFTVTIDGVEIQKRGA